jgi:hypothetical protein
MMKTRTRVTASVVLAVALAVGTVGAGTASANSHGARQEGLVNVYASDVNVQIPIAIAANICGVAVNLLATEVTQGPVECEAEGVAIAQNERGNGGPGPRQEGLVNVALTDINVQVPVAVAANICGVAVNVLVQEIEQGGVDCEAVAESIAS